MEGNLKNKINEVVQRVNEATSKEYRDEVLVSDIQVLLINVEDYYKMISAEYETLSTNSRRAAEINKEAEEIRKVYSYLKKALKFEMSKQSQPKKNNTGAVVGSAKRVDENKDKKSKGKANLLTGAIIGLALGLALSSAIKNINIFKTETNNYGDRIGITQPANPSETTEPEQVVEEEVLGFIDASDENQIEEYAKQYYDQYIDIDTVPSKFKEQFDTTTMENMLRMMNGEFQLDNGEVDYNSSQFDELGNDINSYHNSTSFKQMGTDLVFKPTAIFFEEGTNANKIAKEADRLMEKVYEDIKREDVEAFRADAIAWGEFVRDTVILNDHTGETISLWQCEQESIYPLLKTITSPYACSIMEYSISVDLAKSKGAFGSTFGICIPFCYDGNEVVEVPLSQIIYDINETPMNDLAQRAGKLDEWKEYNDPIMVQCGLMTKAYFDDKYDREIGQSLALK